MSVGQRNITRHIDKIKLRGVFPGSAAPDVELVTLDGKKFRLADLRGKLVLVDFWATWCGPCVAELPNVREAYEKYHSRGFDVISISFDKTDSAVRSFAKRHGMIWPQILADGADKGPLARTWGVSGIPATFLIGPDGKVLAKDLRGEVLLKRIARETRKLPANENDLDRKSLAADDEDEDD